MKSKLIEVQPIEDRDKISLKLTKMLPTSTSQEIATVMLQSPNIKNAVKLINLKEVDEQCKKLCTRSATNSSVLRVPVSNHKVHCIKQTIVQARSQDIFGGGASMAKTDQFMYI